MPSYRVESIATSTAPPDVVFEHLAVAQAWSVWGRFPRAVRERPGTGEPNGVGSIRKIGPIREETVAFESPGHYGYRLLTGSPIKDYRGDVHLSARDGGTIVRWEATFAPRVPGSGAITQMILGRMISYLARSIARHAGQCRPGCPAHRAG